MKPRRLVVLPAAAGDVRSAVIYYRTEAGKAVAGRFVEALRRQYRAIAERPGIGSLRYETELALDRLRSARVHRFPYLIFYVELEDRIEVWRVLHMSRDIPASLRE